MDTVGVLPRVRGALATMTIALFTVALAAPHVDELLRDAAVRGPVDYENRNPAPFPEPIRGLWTARAWPGEFASWYEDRMGLRDVLLRANGRIKVQGFGVATTDTVLLGKADFLFFRGNHTLEIHRGVRPMSERELEQFRALLENRDAWCRARGIRYLFVVGPDKEGLYPELLPAWFEKLGPTRLEQFREHLARAGSPVEFVDLTEALRAARALEGPRQHAYSTLGTHWDGLGMWAAYHAVATRIARDFPAVAPLAWEELRRDHRAENPDSWAKRMYVEDLLDPHCTIVSIPAEKTRRRVLLTEQGPGTRGRSVVNDPRLPRLVVTHDSFGLGVLDLLTEHASNAITIFDASFDAERIEKARPDVVIDWFVERIFDYWTPQAAAVLPTTPPVRAPEVEVERLWSFAPERAKAELAALGGLAWRVVEGAPPALEVDIGTTGDLLELPRLVLPPGRTARFHAELESAVGTRFDLYYRRLDEEEYKRRNAQSAQVDAGETTIEIELERAWFDHPLRLRPGIEPGTYRFTRLEVRLDPAPSDDAAPATSPAAPGAKDR
ncbi:MAG: hypothetical protein IPJ77_11380 [Planctomycetes bacterium]|nr:hypothetical protein [Planctomycetota bacterium]